GIESAPITLMAQNSRKAVLSSLASGACQPSINVHASYITVQGLRIEKSPNAANCGQYSPANAAIFYWWDESYFPNINGTQGTGKVGGVIRDVQIDPSADRSIGVKT